MSIALILYLLAVVLITIRAFGGSLRWVDLGWLGVAIAAFTALVLPQLR